MATADQINVEEGVKNMDANLLAEVRKSSAGLGRGERMMSQRQRYLLHISESGDTGIESQGSSWTFSSVGTGNWTMATMGSAYTTDAAYLETILRGDDMNYMKQKYGNISIVVSCLQLFFLVMVIAVCGFAPISINPSIGPYPDILSMIGSTNSYEILKQGQIWRFITSPFITAGILHFLCIIGIQLELGAFFEREWGSSTWLQIYTASAIGSTMCDTAFNSYGVCVGSTGPLVGLFGAKIGEIIMLMSFKTKDSYLVDGMHQLMAVLFTLFFVSLLLCFPYVEWGGHFGGFVTGLVVGMMIFTKKLKYRRDKLVWFGSGLMLTILCFFIFCGYLIESNPSPDLADVCEYYENIHPENYDCRCAF